MKKNAIWGLLLATLLPVTGYLLVKHYSKDALHIPRRYFYDSVTVDAKGRPDTVWHQIKDMEFTNQFGEKVSLSDAHGKIIVMNFFFTRCPTICPGLTRNMKRLQTSFGKNPEIVQFISVSVDPEHDSAHNLRHFADRMGANHDNWWFVTGPKKEIYEFSMQEIKANIADTKVDTAFIHTENFFLIDTNRVVRGWYNGFDSVALRQLAFDIPTLRLEKTKNSKSVFRGFIPILPLIFGGIAGVMIVMYILNKKRNNA